MPGVFRLRWPWNFVAVATVLLVVIGLFLSPRDRWPFDECGGGSGIWRTDPPHAECIGLTDGGDAFNDPGKVKDQDDEETIKKINAVQKKIFEENKEVGKGERYVKIVLLMPLTVSGKKESAIPLSQIRHALEGIYTAQYRANHLTAFGDPGTVKLQVLLANQGSRQEADEDFVDRVLKVSDPDHRLVAVVGLGSSVPNTEVIAGRLADKGIPMVSAITSSDTLTGLPKLWSVSPSNTQYIGALGDFLDHGGKNSPKSGLIVSDANEDPYTKTLKQGFAKVLARYINYPTLTYTGGTLDERATPNIFAPVVTNLCNAVNTPKKPLDSVFYAGRVADFEAFAKALENRICKKNPLTVLVGATGFAEAQRYEGVLRNGKVTVVYASSSDPVNWNRKVPGTPPGYAEFIAAHEKNGYDKAGHAEMTEALMDGLAIAHHDALATAALATRLATPGKAMPTPEAVSSQFNQLVLAYTVEGASGSLTFPDTSSGRAMNRVIPLRQIPDDSNRLPKDLKPNKVTGP